MTMTTTQALEMILTLKETNDAQNRIIKSIQRELENQGKQNRDLSMELSTAKNAIRDLVKGLPWLPMSEKEFMSPDVKPSQTVLDTARRIVAEHEDKAFAIMNDESDPVTSGSETEA